MATESDLVTMLNKLLDSHMTDVSSRLLGLEQISADRALIIAEFRQAQTELKYLWERVRILEGKVSRA